MSFQDELRNTIENESSKMQRDIDSAHLNAKFDFQSIKEQIKWAVNSKYYSTNSDGTHDLTVMYPYYPNTKLRFDGSNYLQLKLERSYIQTGIFSKKKKELQKLVCYVTDQKLYNEYLLKLKSLCKAENIDVSIVATSTLANANHGVASTYKPVPGIIVPNQNYIVDSYHLRLLAHITF